MRDTIDRREFLKLAGLGGAVFASGLAGCAGMARPGQQDSYFVQLSDTHWASRARSSTRTRKAAAAVNELQIEPDFIVFTGDPAKSLIFPLPAPGSRPKREPIAWDPAAPYQGLGFRGVEAEASKASYELVEYPVQKA